MKATVIYTTKDGIVTVKIRRGFHTEMLYGLHRDLKVDDQVEVERQANNPYLVRV